MRVTTSSELKKAGVVATLKQQVLIEDFEGDWQKEWFSYNSKKWGIKTHKLYHPAWEAPKGAKLYFEIKAELPNKMIVGLDSYVTEVALTGNNTWQGVKLSVSDFKNIKMESQNDWSEFKELRFDDVEQKRAKKESGEQPRTLGAPWKGKAPEFRFLRWLL